MYQYVLVERPSSELDFSSIMIGHVYYFHLLIYKHTRYHYDMSLTQYNTPNESEQKPRIHNLQLLQSRPQALPNPFTETAQLQRTNGLFLLIILRLDPWFFILLSLSHATSILMCASRGALVVYSMT
ncbi:hypothetical protein BBK36DRAFT_1145795 [Trichoderma citrinoviride]|uniref:Uncharacterized protein n=1 Tax=Trichoderma citrinoviride TaxID=58853 RepID=A0A2T4AW85_9HYPO|nr:hypothetical protein BBK36DRAFT_1145795 [Trichoderma citrinoviride]PTB61320.1 hypothetical protein BBK36DRAFT_1145795 [Trichoderma citrinoviride]